MPTSSNWTNKEPESNWKKASDYTIKDTELLHPGGQGIAPPEQTIYDVPEPILVTPALLVDPTTVRVGDNKVLYAGGEAPPGSLSKPQNKSIPIRIFNRKVFVASMAWVDVLGPTYKTEPICVEGYQRMDLAWTIHGASRNTAIALIWEHAGIPETQHSENWTTTGIDGQQSLSLTFDGDTNPVTSIVTLENFLPYLRLSVTLNIALQANITAADDTQNMFAEVSLTGHLHEKKGEA